MDLRRPAGKYPPIPARGSIGGGAGCRQPIPQPMQSEETVGRGTTTRDLEEGLPPPESRPVASNKSIPSRESGTPVPLPISSEDPLLSKCDPPMSSRKSEDSEGLQQYLEEQGLEDDPQQGLEDDPLQCLEDEFQEGLEEDLEERGKVDTEQNQENLHQDQQIEDAMTSMKSQGTHPRSTKIPGGQTSQQKAIKRPQWKVLSKCACKPTSIYPEPYPPLPPVPKTTIPPPIVTRHIEPKQEHTGWKLISRCACKPPSIHREPYPPLPPVPKSTIPPPTRHVETKEDNSASARQSTNLRQTPIPPKSKQDRTCTISTKSSKQQISNFPDVQQQCRRESQHSNTAAVSGPSNISARPEDATPFFTECIQEHLLTGVPVRRSSERVNVERQPPVREASPTTQSALGPIHFQDENKRYACRIEQSVPPAQPSDERIRAECAELMQKLTAELDTAGSSAASERVCVRLSISEHMTSDGKRKSFTTCRPHVSMLTQQPQDDGPEIYSTPSASPPRCYVQTEAFRSRVTVPEQAKNITGYDRQSCKETEKIPGRGKTIPVKVSDSSLDLLKAQRVKSPSDNSFCSSARASASSPEGITPVPPQCTQQGTLTSSRPGSSPLSEGKQALSTVQELSQTSEHSQQKKYSDEINTQIIRTSNTAGAICPDVTTVSSRIERPSVSLRQQNMSDDHALFPEPAPRARFEGVQTQEDDLCYCEEGDSFTPQEITSVRPEVLPLQVPVASPRLERASLCVAKHTSSISQKSLSTMTARPSESRECPEEVHSKGDIFDYEKCYELPSQHVTPTSSQQKYKTEDGKQVLSVEQHCSRTVLEPPEGQVQVEEVPAPPQEYAAKPSDPQMECQRVKASSTRIKMKPVDNEALNTEFLYYSSALKHLLPVLSCPEDRTRLVPWVKKLFSPEYCARLLRDKRNRFLLHLAIVLCNDEVIAVFRNPPPEGIIPSIDELCSTRYPPAAWECDTAWLDHLEDVPPGVSPMPCPWHSSGCPSTTEQPSASTSTERSTCADICYPCTQSNNISVGWSLDQEFKLLLNMSRPLKPLMTVHADRQRMVTWLRFLCTVTPDCCVALRSLRNDYMKLLLAYGQDDRMTGPFASDPVWGQALPPLGDAGGDGRDGVQAKPFADPASGDLDEFLRTVPVPNEGAFCYVAVDGVPITPITRPSASVSSFRR